ncbi:MAG TPA: hypothetical protein VJX67_01270, partial [Blastocatellia bacterium]|nr:hypothetical protein [Blastocatellia bacterium]
VTHIPHIALVPNLIHIRLVRTVTLRGNRLTLRTPIKPTPNGALVSSRLVWQRTGAAGRTMLSGISE